jgi:hypothetical protein
MSENFNELIRRHVGAEEAEEQNSEEVRKFRVKWYQLQVEGLFNQIETWIEPLKADGTVTFRRNSAQIRESYFGDYSSSSGIVAIGRQIAKLVPVGTGVMGSFGRVNVEGPQTSVYLILGANQSVPGQPFQLSNPVWYISTKEGGRITRTELTENAFQDLLKELFGIE